MSSLENVQPASRNVTVLADVKEQSDFDALYSHQGLGTLEAKIRFLMDELGILATRCEGEETLDEELFGLEEYALSHPWQREAGFQA